MLFSGPAQQPIRADSAADTDLLHGKLGCGICGFTHQDIHHCHLKSGCNIDHGLRLARLGSVPFELAHQIENSGLQAGEAEIEAVLATDGQDGGQGRCLRVRLELCPPTRPCERAGELETAGIPGLCGRLNGRAARIAQLQESRHLVERFPGGIVQGRAQEPVATMILHQHEFGMAAGNDQNQRRELFGCATTSLFERDVRCATTCCLSAMSGAKPHLRQLLSPEVGDSATGELSVHSQLL